MNKEELLSKVWYLAHPYSGDQEGNFKKVNEIGAQLFKQNVIFFSPISMSHPIHLVEDNSTTWKQWMRFDKWFMDKCDGLILSPLWTKSKGCRYEYYFFKNRDKPILNVDDVMLILDPIEDADHDR